MARESAGGARPLRRRDALPSACLPAGVALAIFVTILLSVETARVLTGIAPLWLAPSILLVALLRNPGRRWPLLLVAGAVAAVGANLVVGKLLRDALMHGAINAIAPWLLAALLSRCTEIGCWYRSPRWTFWFVALALGVSALSALVGVSWRAFFYGTQFAQAWPEWFVSNALGYVIGTLFLLSWTEPMLRRSVTAWRLAETAVLTGLVALVSYLAFTTTLPLLFLTYPVLALATVRGRLPGATAGTLAFSAVATWSMVAGIGPIATLTDLGLFERALILRGCLLTALLSTIPVAVVLTLRELFTERLKRQDSISSAALNNMAQGLCMFDKDYRLVTCNRRYAELYHLPDHLLIPGTPGPEIASHRLSGSESPKAAELQEYILAAAAGAESQLEFDMPDGRIIEVQRRLLPDGGWVSTHEDVTEKRRAAERIAYLANHDSLTGLSNRANFREHLERSITHAERGHRFALHCLDLDRFKAVNDTLGHAAGDELLRQVAQRLRKVLRNSDLVARLGGDEFAVLQFPIDRPQEAGALAARLVEALGEPYQIEGHEALIGTSIGISLAPDDTLDASELIQQGDLALYRAKSDGRNGFCFFEPGMDRLLHQRRLIESELRAAIQKGEFELYYQPILNLQSDTISGLEALLRWNHPTRGIVEPAEFISIAEESGLIIPLGEWVVRHACREAATWPAEVKVAVNLSPVQFKSRSLAALVLNAASAAGLSPHRLELEITESLLLQDSEEVLETLHKLRDAGVTITMDDFGTGYSSLSYLRSFPFHKVKIDRSFVHDLPDRGDSLAIVHATTELSEKLGMLTTAEGVETAEQLAIVRAEGCTEVQGYLVSRPVRSGAVSGLLARYPRTPLRVVN